MTKTYFIQNGKLYFEGEKTVSIQSRGLRYGEGFFDTIKAEKGIIQFKELHFQRIKTSFEKMGYKLSSVLNLDIIELNINKLLIKNNHLKTARLRIMFYGKNGGLYEGTKHAPDYVIESSVIDTEKKLNSNGLTLDIYRESIKSCDGFSNLKSNNFLPYAMGAAFTKKHNLNDCILLNMFGRVCDTTIANIFIIKDHQIITPSLGEGCISGVMRRYLLEALKGVYHITEGRIELYELYEADEVFTTNVIKGIRWVKKINQYNFNNKLIKEIYNHIHSTLNI